VPMLFISLLQNKTFMNTIDIVLGIILICAFYTGLKKGLFATLASLIGLIAGVYGAIHFSHFAANFLSNTLDWNNDAINLTAFGVTFLIIIIVVTMAGKILTKIADFAALGIINKLLGGLFNSLKIAFIVSVVFMFINASTNVSGFLIPEEKKKTSLLYEPVAAIGPLVLPNIIEEVDKLQKYDNDPVPIKEETDTN
jgi:membrane protein required for colicin V production